MSDLRAMKYTTETVDRIVLGPYTGRRYGGMSDDVVLARLTVAYRFAGFDILVKDVPAKWDRHTGAEYITGRIGRDIYERVERIARSLRSRQTTAADAASLAAMIGSAPKSISIATNLAA